MEFNLRVGDDGMPCIHASVVGSGVVYPRGDHRFEYSKQNMYMSEYKIKGCQDQRRFIISIRLDGIDGKCKLTQMNFRHDDMLELRNKIDELLRYKATR